MRLNLKFFLNLQGKNSGKKKVQSSKKVSTGVKRKRKSSENERLKQRSRKSNKKFRKESLVDVLSSSLNWESIEQLFFWEILVSHDDVTLEYLLPIFNRLDSVKHSEAVCYLFQMIKSSEPTYELIRYITHRRVDDNIARALFINWAKKTPTNQMSQMFIKLMNKSAIQQSSGGKPETTLKKIKFNESLNSVNKVKLTAQQQLQQNQKRGSIIYDEEDLDKVPNLDQVLGHLNKLRLNNSCIGFILNENLIECLKKIYNKYLDDDLKKKYSDLFTLADEFIQNEEQSDPQNEEQDEEEDNSDSEEENRRGRKNRPSKKSKRNSRGKSGKKPRFKASSSGDEDCENGDENEDDNEENEESDHSSESEMTKKKKQKRGQTGKSSNQQPPRKKLKHLKSSDNDSDE